MHNNQKIPEGWSVKKISDLGTTVSGGTPDTNNPEYWDGDVLWVTPSEVSALSNRFIWDTERKITEKGLKQSSAKLLPVNSLIICTRATIGDCCINKKPICTNQGFKNIIVTGNNVDFLYYLISKNKHELIRKACGSTFLEISKKDIDNLKFPIPPLPEQEKIAEILGTWDEAIEKLTSLIEQKKLLKKGLMQKLLTGKVRLFKTSPLAGEVADLSAGEGLDNNDNIKISSHRMYQPYIKEFSRDMRKNSTKAENLLWQKIRNGQLGFKFRRQHQIDNKYIADFVCLEKRLIIELDGGQHNDRPKDKDRTLYLENNNFKVIRFWDNEILQNIDGCLEILLKEISLLNNPSPCPSPARGEGISATYSNSLPQEARKDVEYSLDTPHLAQECHPLPQGARKNERFSQPWKEVKLGEIGTISSAGVDKKIVEGEDLVELLNYMDVYKKDFLYKTDTSMTVSAPMRQIKNCNLRKGDIFFTPSSETPDDIAHSAVVMEDIPNGVYSYHIIRLRPTTLIDLKFSAYAFKTAKFYKQAYAWCEGSGQRYVISQDDFRNMKIYIPSNISEQHAIAEVLSTADDEINLLNQKLEALKEQKKGLMQQLLTGQVRVKVN